MSEREDFAKFKAACLLWQRRLGLQDWRFAVDFKRGKGVNGQNADVSYDIDCRHAIITFYGKSNGAHPVERSARHEVFHVLLADALKEAAACRSDCHKDVVREEHRLIERLLNLTDEQPSQPDTK